MYTALRGRSPRTGRAVLFSFVLATAILATSCSREPHQLTRRILDASWANAYPTIAQMAQHADAVAFGAVTAITSRGVDGSSPQTAVPYTEFTFAVSQWVLGKYKDSSIVIKQSGQKTTTTDIRVVDDPLMAVGEHDVVFLKQYASGHYFIMGGPTGRVLVRDGVPAKLASSALRDQLAPTTAGLIAQIRSAGPS